MYFVTIDPYKKFLYVKFMYFLYLCINMNELTIHFNQFYL